MIAFIKNWWIALAFAAVFLFSTYGLRLISDSTYGDSATPEKDLGYVTQLSVVSPKARVFLESYFKKHGKREVMGKHYQHMCAVVTRLALEDKDTTNMGFSAADEFKVCDSMSKKMYFRDNLPI
jgi:hypothetical protein